MFPAIWHPSHS